MKYVNLDKYLTQIDPFYFGLEKLLLTKPGDFSFVWDVFPAVIIGKHQIARQEVNLKYLEEQAIKLFRRPSGGGAVYSDSGCIKYSFIDKNKTKDQMYETYLFKIQEFLAKYYHLNAIFSGRNDLLIDGYKFSGNAYYQTKDGSVLHGTILFDTDLNKLVNVLTPSQEKLLSKGVKSVSSRVINLSSLISISRKQFIADFKEYLNTDEYFLNQIDELLVQNNLKIFNSEDYIYGLEPKYSYLKSKRFSYGEVALNYEVENNLITKIKITGDFFAKKAIEQLEQALIGMKLQNPKLDLDVNEYIDNMKNEDFLKLLKG